MTNAPNTTTSTDKKQMSPEDVLDFLRDTPNFINEHPQAIELLLPPQKRPKKGEVADFQAYMIDRLKADKQEIMEDARTIIETSRANMNNQQRIHNAVLHLLEAQKFDDFIQAITIDLATLLDVDIAVFLVEANDENIQHIQTNGIRLLPKDMANQWMENKTVLMQNNISGIEAIYGGGAALVKSQILLRIDISMDTPPAILAFGSRHPEMFDETQATDQILFMARIIERCFRLWLNIQA